MTAIERRDDWGMVFEFVALMTLVLLVAIVFLVVRLSADDRRREEAQRR